MIYKNETEYLEDTPAGNIIVGFEGYTKGSSGAAAGGGRRKGNVVEGNRVFSRCSVTFGPPGVSSFLFLGSMFLGCGLVAFLGNGC